MPKHAAAAQTVAATATPSPSLNAARRLRPAAARLTIRNAGLGLTIPTKFASANPAKDRA